MKSTKSTTTTSIMTKTTEPSGLKTQQEKQWICDSSACVHQWGWPRIMVGLAYWEHDQKEGKSNQKQMETNLENPLSRRGNQFSHICKVELCSFCKANLTWVVSCLYLKIVSKTWTVSQRWYGVTTVQFHIISENSRGTWLAQSVHHATLELCSSPKLVIILEFS